MKKLILLLALVAASFSTLAQQTAASATTALTGYSDLMAATITELDNTRETAQLKQLASKFERAATAALTDWLPPYYQAYSYVLASFQSTEDGVARDKYLDQAEAALTQARKLGGDEAELLVLQGYLYMGRLAIDPMSRFMEYEPRQMDALERAKKLNPTNPRPYLVQANLVFRTPSSMGGGPAAAKPLYEQAKARFATFQPRGPLAPNWGEKQLLRQLKTYESVSAN